MIKQKSLGTYLVVKILLVMLLIPSTAKSRIQSSGYIEYQDRRENSDAEGRKEVQNTTLRLDASTYLWEPWIAIISGGLGLTYNTLKTHPGEQHGELVTGNAQLNLFPRSHFPFRMYAESRDSRVSGDVAGNNYSTEIYGFSQFYTPVTGPRLGIQYRNTQQEEVRVQPSQTEQQTVVNNESLQLNLKQNFDNNNFNFDSSWDEIQKPGEDLLDNRNYLLLRHNYRPDVSLNVSNSLSSTQTNVSLAGSQSETQRHQLSSTAFWRPATDKPLMVTGSVLLTNSESINNSLSSGIAKTSMITTGVSYEILESLNLRASLSYAESHSQLVDSESSIFKAGLAYAGRTKKLADYDYRWSAQSDIALRSGVDNAEHFTVNEYSLGGSHGISKVSTKSAGTMQFNLSQQVLYLADSTEKKEHVVSHSAMLGWSGRAASNSTLAQLSATDRRRVSENEDVYQVVNLQVSRTHQLDRMSAWSGNITLQASRVENLLQDTDWQTVANIDINYYHRQAFGVPMLRFFSEYRYLSEELARTVLVQSLLEEQQTHYWKNRLEYQLGRFQVSLHANITERDSKRDRLLMLRLRRNFGSNGL